MARRDWWLGVALVSLAALSPTFVGAIAGDASNWVLWEKNLTTKDGNQTPQWEPLDGFDSLADCQISGQQILQTALTYYLKDGGGKLLGDVRPDGRSAMFAVGDAGAQHTVEWRYLCFPGTFEPRSARP